MTPYPPFGTFPKISENFCYKVGYVVFDRFTNALAIIFHVENFAALFSCTFAVPAALHTQQVCRTRFKIESCE